MRILYHHRTLGDGAEGIHVAEMVRALERLGHEVRVVSLIGERTNVRSARQRRWARVARLLPGFLYELGELSYNVTGSLLLERAVREFHPDAIYDRYVSYSYAAVLAARRHRLPILLEVNSPYSYQKQTFDERLYFPRLNRSMERRICRDATTVITVSTPLKKFLVSIGVPGERVVVMPNGVDSDAFHPGLDGASVRASMGAHNKLVVGFTGILRPWHGLELLLDAFSVVSAQRDDLHLLIVGDGPSRAPIEREAANRGLADRVTITGRQPHEAVRGFVAAMDVTVSPRATFYASPMKIVEYMGMGKTIVAPDMENIRDLITGEVDGVLFTPESSRALADALLRVLADAELRRRLGDAARATVLARRTWLHNAHAVVELFERFSES
ncbi:MAG TPA: glycosyltransferase family 4 protein [Candidatus Eisenbacteria bacterium]|jgi:glycosyltransferase involved in cell wall biosynthesis